MLNTDHTISQIALDNGFCSSRGFSGEFQKRYGVLPSEMRKQINEKGQKKRYRLDKKTGEKVPFILIYSKHSQENVISTEYKEVFEVKIQNVTDASFRKYGKVLEGYDFSALLKEMKHTPVPDDVVYVPSVEELEALDVAKALQNKGFGGIPIEIGYCNGHNKKLNAVEYHRSSEINVAVTDLVLLIGSQQDITDDFTYDTSKIEAFLVPAGTGIEVYATTLHYAPCNVQDGGFQCVVVLPAGTNTDLTFETAKTGEDSLLTAKNKWLIAHEDAAIEGAVNGLRGENITID